MQPIVTDRVAWSVGRSVSRSAKMAALIEMPFGLTTWVCQRYHVLHGGPDPPWEGAIWGGKGASRCKV